VQDKRKLDAVDMAEIFGKRVDVKIPSAAFMAVPLHVMGIGIDYITFLDAMFPVDFQDDFQVGMNAMPQIKINLSPTDKKFIVKIINPLKISAQISMNRRGIVFRKLHFYLELNCFFEIIVRLRFEGYT
jgi:hypothetical protein